MELPLSTLPILLNNVRLCNVLRSDLPKSIGYDLLKLEDGYIDPDVDESTKAFVDQRNSSGAEKVMLWNSVALTNVLAVARLPD